MKRVLVTGGQGFTGRYLVAALRTMGADVFTTHAPYESRTAVDQSIGADLLDVDSMRRAVRWARPEGVVHLAAVSLVVHEDVDRLYRTNVVGTRNLLHALCSGDAPKPQRVLLASSANVYGNSEIDPISEDVPPRPANDYAVSKLAMEHMGTLWREPLPIVVVRPFNYTGVGQSTSFLVPKVVAAFKERRAVLELGDLDVARDFSDVRDVARAYAELLRAPQTPSLVNICSGRAVSVRELLAMARAASGHDLDVQTNPALLRANEVRRLRGSTERLKSIGIDWHARPLSETVSWMMNSH
jgi:GDP-6-deoxy-D-talose 4-dehydrogenase